MPRNIEGKEAATPAIVISEVSPKLQKEIALGNEPSEGRLKRLEFIRTTSQIVGLDFEIAAVLLKQIKLGKRKRRIRTCL